MNLLTDDILRVAFNLQKGEALSEEQQAICLEWMTGKAQEYLTISIDDPRLLELAAFFDVLENRKTSRWKQIK
jgi:hypothetical protein